jgi:hypothetical protein
LGNITDTLKTWGLGLANDLTHSKVFVGPINDRIRNYGEITDLTIDRRNRKISAACILKGQESPVRIVVEKYVIRKADAGYVLVVEEVSVSLLWIDNLAQDFLVGREISFPEELEPVARMLQ